MMGLIIFITIIISQYLAFTFVYNLQNIRRNIEELTNDKLLKTVKKYSVLSVISVMFSTLYALMMIIISLLGITFNHTIANITGCIICLDVFIDTLCMILSLNMNDKYYQRICFINCGKT